MIDPADLMDSRCEDNLMLSKSLESSALGVQVISSSGGHIIAVANPAMAMSPALINEQMLIKRETVTPDL